MLGGFKACHHPSTPPSVCLQSAVPLMCNGYCAGGGWVYSQRRCARLLGRLLVAGPATTTHGPDKQGGPADGHDGVAGACTALCQALLFVAVPNVACQIAVRRPPLYWVRRACCCSSFAKQPVSPNGCIRIGYTRGGRWLSSIC